jgi:dipeptide/tripeptide permease
MKAILIYYLYYSVAEGGFGLSQAVAMQIVAIYGTEYRFHPIVTEPLPKFSEE